MIASLHDIEAPSIEEAKIFHRSPKDRKEFADADDVIVPCVIERFFRAEIDAGELLISEDECIEAGREGIQIVLQDFDPEDTVDWTSFLELVVNNRIRHANDIVKRKNGAELRKAALAEQSTKRTPQRVKTATKRAERRARGLCTDCTDPVTNGKIRCEKHLKVATENVQKTRKPRGRSSEKLRDHGMEVGPDAPEAGGDHVEWGQFEQMLGAEIGRLKEIQHKKHEEINHITDQYRIAIPQLEDGIKALDIMIFALRTLTDHEFCVENWPDEMPTSRAFLEHPDIVTIPPSNIMPAKFQEKSKSGN